MKNLTHEASTTVVSYGKYPTLDAPDEVKTKHMD
jgi:hypothetical protein